MMFLLNQIPSETQIKKQLRELVFGHNIVCPRCHTRKIKASEDRYWCRVCRKHFSILSGIYLKSLKLSLRVLWAILWCFVKQVPVKQAMSLTNLSETSVRHAYDLFRSQIPQEFNILSKKVQLDEAFFFGKRGKALMLAKQVGTRQLAYEVVTSVALTRTHAANFLFQNIQPRSQLQTDGGSIYKKINNWWPITHKKDIHSKWEFSLTSEIEGMFGLFRTFIRRMYHHVTKENFDNYVREFCARFSSPQMFNSPNDFLTKTIKSVPFD